MIQEAGSISRWFCIFVRHLSHTHTNKISLVLKCSADARASTPMWVTEVDRRLWRPKSRAETITFHRVFIRSPLTLVLTTRYCSSMSEQELLRHGRQWSCPIDCAAK